MKKVVVFLLVAIPVLTGNAFADILIVANKNVPVTTPSREDIREIFLGKRVQWGDNSKIRFATVMEKDVHEAFLKQYLKKSPGKWKVYWKRMIFTGKGVPPESVTEAELIAWVAENKGAVGYVSSRSISPEDESTVKILKIK